MTAGNPLNFTGTYRTRSSGRSCGGAPGESEIHELNPERERSICEATGWPRLEPGSLNLDVRPEVVEALGKREPLVAERPEQVRYPDRFSHIPSRRGGYRYYEAVAQRGGKVEAVVVRRAVNPHSKQVVELYAPVKLTAALSLEPGDTVDVEVVAAVESDRND